MPLEHNSGACVARNKGLELAKGEFISFLDDDDTWEPEKISEQIGGFTSKKIGMVYSPFYNIDSVSYTHLFLVLILRNLWTGFKGRDVQRFVQIDCKERLLWKSWRKRC